MSFPAPAVEFVGSPDECVEVSVARWPEWVTAAVVYRDAAGAVVGRAHFERLGGLLRMESGADECAEAALRAAVGEFADAGHRGEWRRVVVTVHGDNGMLQYVVVSACSAPRASA